MTINKSILRTTLIASLALIGYSFAYNQNVDIEFDIINVPEDSTKTEFVHTYSQEYVDSINALLDAKNLEGANSIAKVEEETLTDIPHRSTWNTSMGSASVHTVEKGRILKGIASYYHDKFVGRKTANGEIFSQSKYTAACNKLPLGTYLKVTNLKNKKTVVVKVNDRLAKHNKRVVDLSKASAKKIGSIRSGLAKVKVEVIPAEDAKAILATY